MNKTSRHRGENVMKLHVLKGTSTSIKLVLNGFIQVSNPHLLQVVPQLWELALEIQLTDTGVYVSFDTNLSYWITYLVTGRSTHDADNL